MLVSRDFCKEALFENNTVYEAEIFIKDNILQITIVAGFNILVHEKSREKLLNQNNIKKIYVLDGWNVFSHNRFKFLYPKVFLIDDYYKILIKRNFDYIYFEDYYNAFYKTYMLLEDEKSKEVMRAYLKAHIELSNFPYDLIYLDDKEIFMDCATYTGDTLEDFTKKVNYFEKYYALEPDSRRFKDLNLRLKNNIIHVPIGAWNRQEILNSSLDSNIGEITSKERMKG